MARYALLALVVGMLIGAEAKEDPTKADLKKLKGTWVLVSGMEDGKKLPKDALKGAELMIDGDNHTVKVDDSTYKGTHKLDATTTPKTIDITDTEGPFKGKTVLGIYELTGNEFKLCYALPGKDRPKEFSAKAGSETRLHVWKRKKS